MNAIVADRGQVTIPKALRRRLGIGPRTVLDFTAENGRLIAVKATPSDAVTKVLGCLKLGQPTDAWIADIRGER
jgi:AbrB family looped-hinge helix DNA binding protein